MATVQRLDELHRRAGDILRIVDDGVDAIETHAAERWKALALARFQLLKALDRFISYKDEEVLVHLVVSPEERVSAPAKIMRSRNRDLQHAYDKFVQRWVLTSPLDVDEFYRADAKVMADYIKGTVTADVTGIVQLSARAATQAG